jgi:tetratricopeptide (TPR) repeat protein
MKSIVCTSCGSKFAATRDRCPKCLALVVKIDVKAEAARSKRMARAAAVVLGSAVLALAVIWTMSGSGRAAKMTAPAADRPETSRRAAAEATTEVAAPNRTQNQHAFMDPAAAGTHAYGSGDYQGALAQFEEAVKRNPRDPEAINNLAQVLVRLGRATEALPHFERACSLNPDKWSYRFNLARALSQLNRWDESVASYRQAQQLYPDDYVTTFNLALTLHKKGDEAGAVAEYEKAIALNPEDASFRMALGISYEALQRTRDAAAAYSEYLRLAPTAGDAEKVRARIAQLVGASAPPALPAPAPRANPAGA